jgi:DNA-binding MarR family transcriptional regulator
MVLDSVANDAYAYVMRDVSKFARRMAAECPGFRVRQASRVLSKLYDDELRQFGLQHSQLPVLAVSAIFGDEGAPMRALADALVMDPTTLSRSVRPLEKAGLIRVARSPSDRRSRVLVLTAAGQRAIESAFPAWERVLNRVNRALGPGAMDELRGRLDQVIALSAP